MLKLEADAMAMTLARLIREWMTELRRIGNANSDALDRYNGLPPHVEQEHDR